LAQKLLYFYKPTVIYINALKTFDMKTAAFLTVLSVLASIMSVGSDRAHYSDTTLTKIKGYFEIPLAIVPLSGVGAQFPDQALTPYLDPMFSFGGSYAYYPSANSNFAIEARLMGSIFYRNSWDLDYRLEIARGVESTLNLRSELTTFSLGMKYVPRLWYSPVRPFGTIHFGRAFMHNSISVEEVCIGDEEYPGMHDRFLRQNGYTYGFELGLEYDTGELVLFLSVNYNASLDEFEYYDFDRIRNVRPTPAAKSLVSQDEIRSELVEFHKTAPRYRGRLSMFGFQVGAFWRLAI
jgi:hypothetical protein